jgi:hypothetical protein
MSVYKSGRRIQLLWYCCFSSCVLLSIQDLEDPGWKASKLDFPGRGYPTVGVHVTVTKYAGWRSEADAIASIVNRRLQGGNPQLGCISCPLEFWQICSKIVMQTPTLCLCFPCERLAVLFRQPPPYMHTVDDSFAFGHLGKINVNHHNTIRTCSSAA